MIKTVNANINTNIEVEIDAQDVEDFLTHDYYDLSSGDRECLLEIMKEIVLDSSLQSLKSKLDINNMIYLFKYNSDLACEVKEYLNKNEMVQ